MQISIEIGKSVWPNNTEAEGDELSLSTEHQAAVYPLRRCWVMLIEIEAACEAAYEKRSSGIR